MRVVSLRNPRLFVFCYYFTAAYCWAVNHGVLGPAFRIFFASQASEEMMFDPCRTCVCCVVGVCICFVVFYTSSDELFSTTVYLFLVL